MTSRSASAEAVAALSTFDLRSEGSDISMREWQVALWGALAASAALPVGSGSPSIESLDGELLNESRRPLRRSLQPHPS